MNSPPPNHNDQAGTGTQLPLPAESSALVGGGDFEAIGSEFLGHFITLAGLQPHEWVLDIGCGVGRMTRPLARYLSNQAQYWGVDVSRSAIEWCQANITTKLANFHFQALDVSNQSYNPGGRTPGREVRLPFLDRSFDFVFLTSVFSHLLPADAEHYLSEVARVLKDDGRCLATFFLLNQQSEALQQAGLGDPRFEFGGDDFRFAVQDKPEAAVALPEASVRSWIRQCGLQVVEPIRHGTWSSRPGGLSYQDIVVFGRPGSKLFRPSTGESSQAAIGNLGDRPSTKKLPHRVIKSPQVDIDQVGSELVLMHMASLQLRVLNETAAVLWEALDAFPNPAELAEILVEVDPAHSWESHAANVAVLIDDLVDAGFLIIPGDEDPPHQPPS